MYAQEAVRSLPATRIFHISKHGVRSSNINVIDVTAHVSPQLGRDVSVHTDDGHLLDALHKEVEEICKTASPTPYLAVKKKNIWAAHFVVSSLAAGAVADIKVPVWYGRTTIAFRGGASQTTTPPMRQQRPPVVVRPQSTFSRRTSFVVDSVSFRWEMDSRWHSKRFTLCRGDFGGGGGGGETGQAPDDVCAHGVQGSSTSTAATIILDASKVDDLAFLLTAWDTTRRIKEGREAIETI
ncbi:MAG: hypothetical protein M1815_000079 [Lichina confinis]|nr:MAG: hypothetical protein M1815_000079 [Lichina confinis]